MILENIIKKVYIEFIVGLSSFKFLAHTLKQGKSVQVLLHITAENIFYILYIRESNTGGFMHQKLNPGLVEICGNSGSVTTLYTR